MTWKQRHPPTSGTCQRCGNSWSHGDRSGPGYYCDCAEAPEADPREAGDDDGQEYADPRDAIDERLTSEL